MTTGKETRPSPSMVGLAQVSRASRRALLAVYSIPETFHQTQTEANSMANGTWKRSTAASRRAERKVRHAHTSVLVGVNKYETGMLIPTRTPKGEGSTAKRAQPKQPSKRDRLRLNPIGHDLAGKYPGRLASVEKAARDRRKVNQLKRRPLTQLLTEALEI
jgi:methylmalonyl-CoA mutase N-terminal domain/subunit